MDEIKDLDKLEILTKVEKEAMCYRLLVMRDNINEALRKVQNSMNTRNDSMEVANG